MRAKWPISTAMFKFIRLAKNRVVALYAIDYFPCSCFQSTRFTTTFAWFVAGNTGKYRKSVSAMFACFVDFWFMFHGITVTRVATMSSKMPVSEDSRGKKLNSGSTVVSSEVKLMCSIAGWRYGSVA